MPKKSKLTQLAAKTSGRAVLAQRESKSFAQTDDYLRSGSWLPHLAVQRTFHPGDPRAELVVGELIENRDDDIYRTAFTVN